MKKKQFFLGAGGPCGDPTGKKEARRGEGKKGGFEPNFPPLDFPRSPKKGCYAREPPTPLSCDFPEPYEG